MNNDESASQVVGVIEQRWISDNPQRQQQQHGERDDKEL